MEHLSSTFQTNTFQCVLATNGTRSYVILLYADLQWATADTCSGSGSGSGSGNDEECILYANPAQAGFSAGDGLVMRYFTLNGSSTDAVLSLNSTSNIGRPGVWIFQVDGDQVVSAGKPEKKTAFSQLQLWTICASSVILCL